MVWLFAPVVLVLMIGVGLGAYVLGRFDRGRR
jgi:hypothetical protein